MQHYQFTLNRQRYIYILMPSKFFTKKNKINILDIYLPVKKLHINESCEEIKKVKLKKVTF